MSQLWLFSNRNVVGFSVLYIKEGLDGGGGGGCGIHYSLKN